MTEYTEDDLAHQMEEAVGELFKVFYRMRQAKLYKMEYESMDTVLIMLSEDRQHLRAKYPEVMQ